MTLKNTKYLLVGGGEAIDSSCPWLVKGRKKGYMVSDPDDIGTVRLVGWLMMVSCPNSTYSFLFLLLLGSRLVCELGPVSIPSAHGEGCGASLSMLLPLPVRWLPLSPLIRMLPSQLRGPALKAAQMLNTLSRTHANDTHSLVGMS